LAEQREQYLLNRTPQFNLGAGAEVRSDLSLTPNSDINKGVIICSVQYNGNPVANALVKILTVSGNPIDHQFTNAEGQAVSMMLPAGTYMVVVSAPGFVSTVGNTVNLPNTTGVILNVSLTLDPRAALNALYGLVLDADTSNRIGTATVTLSNDQGQTVSITTSDDEGEYLFYQVSNGTYELTSVKSGYAISSPLSVTVTGAQLAQTNILLAPETTTNGTVQGFIRDQNGNLLANAFVALYSVNGTETLIRETMTNNNGFYLFGDVLAGNYVVKAKVDVLI